MKQHFNQGPRAQNDSQQHFEYIEFPKAHRRQQEERNKPQSKLSRVQFPRLSDYFPDDSGELEVPLDDGSITNSAELSSESSKSDSRGPAQNHAINVVKVAAKAETAPPASVFKQSPERKTQNPYKEVTSMLPLMESKHKFSSNLSPFRLPSNISEIKPKQTHMYSGRNSQQFLLDLLNQQISNNAKQEQEKKNITVPEKQTKKQEMILEKAQKNQKKIEKSPQKPEPKPQQRLQQKKIPQQEPIKQEPYNEANTKPKRVTINERGKIKFPSDSISCDFDHILPPELRAQIQDSHKRRLTIHEQEEDEEKIVPKQNHEEPMDIVDPREEAEEIDAHKCRETIKQAESRLIQKAQNSAKPIHRDKQKDQKSKIVRVCSQGKNQDEEKTTSRRSSISINKPQAKNGIIPLKKTIQQRKPRTKKPKTEAMQAQARTKKFKKQEQTEVEIVSMREYSPNPNGRPKRYRIKPAIYWTSEKAIYRRGILLGYSSLGYIPFMQVLGFHKPKQIQIKEFRFTTKGISAIITLPPLKTFYSDGINTQRTIFYKLNVDFFKEITISLEKKRKEKIAPKVKCLLDEFTRIDIGEADMKIIHGQTFSIQNLSSDLTLNINIFFSEVTEERK